MKRESHISTRLPQVTKTLENVTSAVLQHPGDNNLGRFCHFPRAAKITSGSRVSGGGWKGPWGTKVPSPREGI
jgi:hypothetical protein